MPVIAIVKVKKRKRKKAAQRVTLQTVDPSRPQKRPSQKSNRYPGVILGTPKAEARGSLQACSLSYLMISIIASAKH